MEGRSAFTLSEEEEHALEQQELGEHALLNDRGNGSHRPTQVRGSGSGQLGSYGRVSLAAAPLLFVQEIETYSLQSYSC